MKVLVVDDELPIVEAVAYNLRKEGYEALTAFDAEQGLKIARTQRPDLIILDVMMPGPDGFRVLEILKSDPETAGMPVIMLTARGTYDDIRHGWQTGNDNYLTKPFNPLDLRTVVRRTLDAAGSPDEPPPLRRWLK